MKDDLAQAALEGERRGRLEGILEGKVEGKLEGKVEGKLEGKVEGKLEGILESLSHVMESFSVDADKAMDALHIPKEERDLYRSKLQ